MSRIGIIREAVEAHGGRHVEVYYADSSKRKNKATDALYKIPRWSDGLSPEARDQVVVDLNTHPEVKHAYLSRGFVEYGLVNTGGHLKVRFYGLARTVVERVRPLRWSCINNA